MAQCTAIGITTDGTHVLVSVSTGTRCYTLTLEADEAEKLAERLDDCADITRLITGPCGADINRA